MGKQVFVNLIADKLDKRVRVEADEDSRLDDLSEFLAEMLVRDSKSIPNAIFSYS